MKKINFEHLHSIEVPLDAQGDIDRDAWLKLRKEGIGGSDAAIVAGVVPKSEYWTSYYELFGIKTGLYTPADIVRPPMFLGNLFEDDLLDFARYWEKDFETSYNNYTKGNLVRNIIKPTVMYRDKKLPFLMGNLDGLVLENGKPVAVCEIKTMGGWQWQQYEGGVPPYHYMQLQHYLMLTKLPHGMLIIVVDNREIHVKLFEADREIQTSLLKKEKKFWKYVEKANKVIAEHKGDIQACEHLIEEPPVDESEATTHFLKERYQEVEEATIEGDENDLQAAKEYNRIKREIKELSSQANLHKNKLMKRLGKNTVMELPEGRITWRRNSRGYRTMRISVT